MSTFDKSGILEIKFSEVGEYGDLIFNSKIKEFAFYCMRKGSYNRYHAWVYNYNRNKYFGYKIGTYTDGRNLIDSITISSRLTIPWEEKENNFPSFFEHFSGEHTIMLYCPELFSEVKPAKR